jgi:carbamoyltransferase
LKRFNEKFPQFKPVKMEGFNRLTGLSTEELIISDFSKNFAASVQKELETVILHLASTLIRRTGEKKLVYAGGIALNCTTNGRIISEGYAEDLYIQPAANDAGVSLGAALHVAYAKGKFNFKPMQTCYYGPEFTDREIEQELKRLKVFYRKEKNISRKTAKEISIGKVVAWFQGKMEVGPRALGSRSIVANPMLEGMNNVVNIIKSREQWRPLAPSVMEEDIDKFFEKAHKNPFMLFTHFVNSKYKKIVPAIVHVDGTTRFQSVSRKVNKNYYNLIDEFGKITGVPIILNTSLNIGGEPIVMTPKQALAAFYNSPIDCLAIGNFWIQKYEKK